MNPTVGARVHDTVLVHGACAVLLLVRSLGDSVSPTGPQFNWKYYS